MRFLIFLLCCFVAFGSDAREINELRSFGKPSLNTLYLFSAPDCPHCREFHRNIFPELLKKYANTGRAQVLIVDMPYNEVALKAVMLMRCLPPDRSEKLMKWLFENQSRWVNTKKSDTVLLQTAQGFGMKTKEFNACVADETLENAILEQRDTISNLYRVAAWPTLVLRQGSVIKQYAGTDKKAILYGVEQDIKSFEKQKALGIKSK